LSETIVICVAFLREKAGTSVARFSHRNSVRLSVCHTVDQSKTVQARITKSSPSVV